MSKYSSHKMTVADIDEMFGDGAEERNKGMVAELNNFSKIIKGNPERLTALTDIKGYCGSQIDGECCAPIPPDVLRVIVQSACAHMLTGLKVDGGKNGGWCVGSMGSRWLDIDPRCFGVEHIRCAFYSKKYHTSEPWGSDKPYAIRIQCEKAR